MRFNESGPQIKNLSSRKILKFITETISPSTKWILLCGSLPPGLPENFYQKIISKIHKKNKNLFTALDTDGKYLRYGIDAKPFLIKPNLWEIERLLDKKIENFKQLKDAGETIINSGISMITITMGEKGAAGFSRQGFFYAKAPYIKNPGSVGCGDAFLAGFIFRFIQTNDFKESLLFATASGAAKATKKFTEVPSCIEVKQMVKKTFICSLDEIDERTKISNLQGLLEKKSKKG